MASTIRTLLLLSIENYENKKFKNYLLQVPLSQMETITFNLLLSELITECSRVRNDEALKIILDVFSSELDSISIYARIFYLNLTEKEFSFILETIEDISYIEIATEIIDVVFTDEVFIMLDNLDSSFFPNSSLNGRKELYDECLEIIRKNPTFNVNAEKFFLVRKSQVSGYANIPEWIVNEMEKIPSFDKIQIEVPEVKMRNETKIDEIFDVITGLPNGVDFSIFQESDKRMRNYLESLEEDDLIELHHRIDTIQLRYSLSDSLSHFRVYGPVHKLIGMELTGEYECTKFGGCRMLTCLCFTGIDYETGVEDPDADWFTGYCRKCRDKIRRKCHAVRFPLTHGGWEGCFCSIECMRDSITEPDLILIENISALEGKLMKNGIQDRI